MSGGGIHKDTKESLNGQLARTPDQMDPDESAEVPNATRRDALAAKQGFSAAPLRHEVQTRGVLGPPPGALGLTQPNPVHLHQTLNFPRFGDKVSLLYSQHLRN